MTNEEIKKAFCDKIERNYKQFYEDWLKMTPEELIEESAFIQATKAMYNYYKEGCSNVLAMQYLVGFRNPLEILRDGIVCDMDGDINSIEHALWEICDRRDVDQLYKKDFGSFDGGSGSPGVKLDM